MSTSGARSATTAGAADDAERRPIVVVVVVVGRYETIGAHKCDRQCE